MMNMLNVNIIKPEEIKPEFDIEVGEYFLASFMGKGKMRLRQLITIGKGEYAIYTPESTWVRGVGTKEHALGLYRHKQKVNVLKAEINVEPVGDVIC
jgi:hypothetical protein